MPHNVAYFLSEQASLHPNAAAVRAPMGREADGAIRYAERSFAELDAEASAAAYYLTDKGIQRGTRVLLMVKPGLDLIRIVFALFRVGAVPIVIDPGMGLRRFLRCVQHSKPAAVVGIPAYLNGYAALPLVSGLMEQGMSAGAGMAFLVAGGITCIPAGIAVWALARPPVFALYLGSAFGGAILFSLAVAPLL